MPYLIAIIVIMAVIIVLFSAREIQRKKQCLDSQRLKEDGYRQQKEILDTIINNITKDMELIGGTEWDTSIHRMPEQYERMKRASHQSEEGKIKILLYDKELGIAKVQGTDGDMYLVNGLWCSCMDYRERGLPCKHMYLLAMEHPEESIYSDSNDALKGLTFALTGLKQAPIKKYIEDHGGKCANFYWRMTAALIKTSDMETKLISHAEELNVAVLSGEDLLSLFRGGHDG